MSYPRNAATPKTVTVGNLTLIADGSAVTSGASVRVNLDDAGWGAGAGTLSYDATSGVTSYAPAQAETNGDVLQIAVYKASCMGCSTTVLMDPLNLAVNTAQWDGGTLPDVDGIGGNVALLSGSYDTLSQDLAALLAAYVEPDPAGTLATALTVIKGATWNASTDTLEAIRDRGDSAWITATGFATPTNITAASGITLAASQHVIVDSGTVTTLTNAPADSAGITTLLTRTPNAVPGATGGLVIAGSNAATTFATLTISSGNLPADVKAYTVQPTVTGATLDAAYDAAKTAAQAATALSTATWTNTKAGYLDAAVSGATAPSAATVADAVLDELLAGHAIAGSAGAALSAAGTASNPFLGDLADYAGDGNLGADLYTLFNTRITADRAAKLDALAPRITVTSPVNAAGDIAIVQGDDYAAADSRALTITAATYTGPVVTGDAIELRVLLMSDYRAGTGTPTAFAASVVVSAGTLTATIPMTAAQTAALTVLPAAIRGTEYHYQLVATHSGRAITVATGTMTVTPRVEDV